MQPQGDRPYTLSFRFQDVYGWAVTAGLCIIPVILWLALNPSAFAVSSLYMLAGNIGKLAGLVGMVMYALNLVYATRLKFLENWFGGLNRVFIAHHILGGLALICLSLHPVLLALQQLRSSVRYAALLLVPNGLTPLRALLNPSAEQHTAVLYQWAVFFGIIAFLGMVVLLVLTFFVKLPYKFWLFTHKFLGVFFFFGGLHVFFIDSDVSEGPLRWYMLTVSAAGLAAYVYRTLLGRILVRKYPYTVSGVKVENDVISIDMTPQKLPMHFKPGQFIFIRFPGAGKAGIQDEWHPFSIASPPANGAVGIKVKALGDFTSSLRNIKPGMAAELEGAYGKFTYSNYANKDQVWIAGGIGITPFLGMAQTLPAAKDYKVDLYYSVKTASELVGVDTLRALVNLPAYNVRVIPYDTSKLGYLTTAAIQKISGDLSKKEFFICGPPAMMKSMRKQLVALGIPNSAIHSEEFAMS